MQWIDGPDKTGSDGVRNEDVGVKPGDHEPVEKRRASQPSVQALELKQHPASKSSNRKHRKGHRIPRRGHKRLR